MLQIMKNNNMKKLQGLQNNLCVSNGHPGIV